MNAQYHGKVQHIIAQGNLGEDLAQVIYRFDAIIDSMRRSDNCLEMKPLFPAKYDDTNNVYTVSQQWLVRFK